MEGRDNAAFDVKIFFKRLANENLQRQQHEWSEMTIPRQLTGGGKAVILCFICFTLKNMGTLYTHPPVEKRGILGAAPVKEAVALQTCRGSNSLPRLLVNF